MIKNQIQCQFKKITNPSQSKYVSMPIQKTNTTKPTPLPPQITSVVVQETIVEVPEIFDPELQIGPTNEQLQEQMRKIEETKRKMAAKQIAEDVQFQVSMNEQENRIAEELKKTQGFGVFVNGAKLYLRSSKHNKYVEGHQNGKVKLSKKKSENTQWIVEYVGLNQIALKNSLTQSYLGSCGKNCALYTTREEKEIWRVEELKGMYAFMNYKGRFLKGGVIRVNLDDHCSEKELWNVELNF